LHLVVFASVPFPLYAADSQPPNLIVTTPTGQVVTNSTMLIEGTANDDVALQNLRVWTGNAGVGYTEVTNLSLSGLQASWEVSVPLSQGLNYFLIQVYDRSNKSQCTLDTADFTKTVSCFQFYVVYYPTNATRIPFEAWRLANFTAEELLNPTISGPDADPDGDGVKNLLEYAWGTNPKAAASRGDTVTPGIGVFAGQNYFTINWVRDWNFVDLSYAPQLAYSLTSPVWDGSSTSVTPVTTILTSNIVTTSVRSIEPITNRLAMFGRVGVSRRSILVFEDLKPILSTDCQSCHQPGGLSGIPWWSSGVYENLVATTNMNNPGFLGVSDWTEEDVPRVMPGFPEFSTLYKRIASTDPLYRMPAAPLGVPLPASTIHAIKYWIETGALQHGPLLTVSNIGGGYAYPDPNGNTADKNQWTYSYDTPVQLYAVASNGWVFSNWSGDVSGTNNPLSVIMSSNVNVMAYFIPTYTLTLNTNGSGSMTANPALSAYPSNSTVTLTATPGLGWTFSNWSGEASGMDNPLIVMMNGNRSLTGNFTSNVPDIMMDNTNATIIGSWTTGNGSSGTGFFGADFIYKNTGSTSNGAVVFQPNLPLTGNYDVYVWYPAIAPSSKRCSDAQYFVSYTGGSEIVHVDQSGSISGQWRLIETAKRFEQGTNGFVRLTNQSADGSKNVAADAVRWVWSNSQ